MDLLNLSSLSHQVFLAIFLFLAATATLYILIAQRQSAGLSSAIRRSLFAFFTSPWGYLRKTVGELALGQENPRLRDTDLYLLNRLIRNAQVGVVTGVVLGGGLIFTVAVTSVLPSPELRESASAAQKEAARTQGIADQTENAIKQQDQDWQTRRAELMKKSEDESRQKARSMQDSLSNEERDLEANPDTARVLAGVKTFLLAHQGDPEAADQAKDFILRMPSLNEEQSAALGAYCDHWAALQSSSSASPSSPEAIRGRLQPDHDKLVADLEGEKEDAAGALARQKDLEKEIADSYKPLNFVYYIAGGWVLILAWIWSVGLGIELFSMGFYLTNDVKQIRTDIEREDSKGMAAAGGR